MLAKHYRAFKQDFDRQGIIFSFSGYMSEGILFSLGEALRQKMTLDDTDVGTVKKVFSVFVEQAQNIIRYSADRVTVDPAKAADLSSGMVTIGSDQGRFYIVCANVVLSADEPRLRAKLERLQKMDKEQIKAYYKEQLREPPEDQSKGATIGLIEIARRASEPIEFDFEQIDDQSYFFCMKVSI